MWWLIIVVTIIIILGVVYFICKQEQYDKISFRETLELTDLPIVTFHHIDKDNNDIKLNFLLDTGANRSLLDIASVEQCDYTKVGKENSLCGLDGVERIVSNVDIILAYNGKSYEEVFQVSDMSDIFDKIKEEKGIAIHGILGNTFFNHYRYVIDFDKLIFYSKTKA